MTSRQNWWRHNSAKTVGIGLNFFLWLFSTEMNNRTKFYDNRFSINVFSKNIGYDVISPSKVSVWICFSYFLTSTWPIVPIFTKNGSGEVYFLQLTYWKLGDSIMGGVNHRTSRGHVTRHQQIFLIFFFRQKFVKWISVTYLIGFW